MGYIERVQEGLGVRNSDHLRGVNSRYCARLRLAVATHKSPKTSTSGLGSCSQKAGNLDMTALPPDPVPCSYIPQSVTNNGCIGRVGGLTLCAILGQ
jgi:hypothetical protein